MEPATHDVDAFTTEVHARFGVLPNFFCSAPSAPGLMEELWGFARSGYLDNPLPALFKERLFVHLSRFCEIRYCIVRHVGFLIGKGRPAGDATVAPHTIDEVIALLARPIPAAIALEQTLLRLEAIGAPLALPAMDTQFEQDVFDVLTMLFVAPLDAARARAAVIRALGERTFEVLTAFLAFVRTAHYWTETHPTLEYEADMLAVMANEPRLAQLLLNSSEAEARNSGEALSRALASLRTTAGVLRTTEERFRGFSAATSDVLFRMNSDWTELHALDGRGLVADSVRPDRDWLNRYVHPDDREPMVAAVQRAVAGAHTFELEHRMRRLDGTFGWTLTRAVPLFDDRGEIVEWFGAVLDVNTRRSAEEALREADRRRVEFLATLAHELRNPLAALAAAAHLLTKATDRPTVAAMARDALVRQVMHMARLLDDLLDIARITHGRMELRKGIVDVESIVEAAIEIARPGLEEKRHHFAVEFPEAAAFVAADPMRLAQVIANLLTNAGKYTDPGGRIAVTIDADAANVTVRVIDNGIGIPAAALEKIFEMFVQEQSALKRSQGGLGVGLALAKGVMKLHAGSIAARSAGPGKGSEFVLTLPRAETPPGEAARAYEQLVRAQRLTIVVADDNKDVTDSLAIALRDAGHDVTGAYDGAEALEVMLAKRPDVAVLDIGMPTMNGYAIARTVRNEPWSEATVLIAISGWGQQADRERAFAAGFDEHLTKPIDVGQLTLLVGVQRGDTRSLAS